MNHQQQRTILLVEDEVLIAMHTARTIKGFGYEVELAYSGEEAVHIAMENDDISLILMDIDLGGGIDGTEAARQILAVRHVPIVFLTSHTEEEYVSRVKEITRYGYIVKNSGDFVLKSSIEMAFELFQAYQKTREHERLLNATGRMAKVGGWELDAATLDVSWTEETYRIHEVPLDYKPPLDEAIHFFHPREQERLRNAIQRALRHGEPYDLELRFITATGKQIWVRTMCQPQIVEGKVVRLIGTFQDIDEQRTAGEKIQTQNEEIQVQNEELQTINDELLITLERLRNSEERLRSLVNTSPFPIAVADTADETILYWSQSAQNMFGHTPNSVSEWYALAYPDPHYRQDVINRWKPFLERAKESKKAINTGEYRIVCQDGSIKICELYAKFIPGSLVVTFHDITERKQAEQELQFQSLLLNQIQDLITATDLDGTVNFINESAARMLGVSQEQMIGRTVFDFGEDESKGATQQEILETTLKHGGWRGEVVNYDRDGNEYILDCRTWTIRDEKGEPQALCSVSTDITERKQAEQALRMHELITATVNDPMSFVDTDYIYRTVNDAYSDFFDMPKEQIIGHHPAEFMGVDVFEQEIKPHLDACFSGEDVHYQVWIDFPTKGQTCMDMHYYPLCAEDGTVLGAVSQGHDMTEFKALEEKLRETNAAKDTFFNIIAHDLRNPVIAFQSGLDVLHGHLRNAGDQFAQDTSAELHKTSERLSAFLDNLLTWARLQSGKFPYHPTHTDLCYTAYYVFNFARQAAQQKDITVMSAIQEGMGVYVDENMVQAVLRNVISNAIKFTPEGGHITVDAREHGEYVEVSVSDSGVGMSEKKRQRLFRVGEKHISSPGTANEKGTGLGLILSREFVEKHGGRIWVESEEGNGSTFRFTLPIRDLSDHDTHKTPIEH